MLASEWRTSKRKKGTTDTSAFSVAWSEHTVRFNENLQIVDLGDCFTVVYGTPASANMALYRYFTVDKQKTLDKLDVKQDDLFYTAKWEKAHQGRTCIKADIAVRFFKNMLPHMKHAVKLAEVLDKDHIDAKNTNAHFEAEEISTANQMVSAAKSSITREEALSKANSALVLSGYNAKLMAEQAEDNLRLKRARDGIELEDIKKQEECRTAIMRVQHQEAQLKMEHDRHFNVNKAKEAAELGAVQIDNLSARYKKAAELGLPLADELKKELEDMLRSAI